ncbi:MAG: secretin N-terminal domain-containing protein [Candidatus Aminicenantaceae bacterium]
MKKFLTGILVLCFLAGASLNVYASAGQTTIPELKTEFVKLKYIKARQVQSLLTGYQSGLGRIRIQDELNIITVQDIPEIVEKMLALLKKIDVKPVDILFTVDLILGIGESSKDASNVSRFRKAVEYDKKIESDPLIKELKKVLSYKYYNKVGSSFLRVQDGGYSDHRIGGSDLDLELRLVPRYVREEKEDVFQLELRLRQFTGYVHEGVKKYQTLINTPLTIKGGERTVVGVSKLDGGDKALILILQGKIVK